jgi:N-methylhydantoinase B
MSNHCIEYVEADRGVIVREYDFYPDSGGAGRWRGGVGQKMTVEILRDGSSVVPRGMEGMRFPAWGVAGGRPSARIGRSYFSAHRRYASAWSVGVGVDDAGLGHPD